MVIIKPGDSSKAEGEFYFECKECGCVWTADRGDSGLKISPPCCEFFAYMKCPNCGETSYDR